MKEEIYISDFQEVVLLVFFLITPAYQQNKRGQRNRQPLVIVIVNVKC